jgi:putative heme-binding domain-containing protein
MLPLRAALFAGIITGLTVALWGQAGALLAQEKHNPLAGDPKAIREGAVLFRQDCVFCHGVGGRGGVRGPDLTTGSWNHGGSDADLSRTITNGIPGTAMGPNQLNDDELWQVISYLRTIQKEPAPATGDAHRGETIFFGSAKCSSCHIVKGRGGRLGPELTYVGSARPRAYLVESIREPNRELTENHNFDDGATLNYDVVTAVTRDGKTIVGVPMNEDTYTVQIMDTKEVIHSLDKKSLKSLRHENRSIMPAYGPEQIGDSDLQDLVSYLQSLRAPSPTAVKGEQRANP